MTAAHWITAAILTAVVGWLAAAGHDATTHARATAQAAMQEREARALDAHRDHAASRACEGRAFAWTDDSTVVCYREAGQK